MKAVHGVAHPRVGLLGNPSDLYDGRVVSFTFEDFSARAVAEPAEAFSIEGAEVEAPTLGELASALRPRDLREGAELLAAAVRVLAAHLGPAGPRVSRPLKLSFTCNVPRQAGLSGSSAIVIATLRALATCLDVALPPLRLAELALAAETDQLGITAGPQDRIVQSLGGLVDMNFAPPGIGDPFRSLDPSLLPPLLIAWDTRPGEDSGAVHDTVRARWEQGDADVVRAIETFPRLAAEGVECLRRGDVRRLKELVDANFDARASVWSIGERDRELIDVARAAGAAAKFCGSGGAAVCVVESKEELRPLEAAFLDRGFPTLRPRLPRTRAPRS